MAVELWNDLRLNAAVEFIYNAVYPSEAWAPIQFEEARRPETIHHR